MASQAGEGNWAENPLAFIGHTVTGVVGSKCSHGYLVKFKVGNSTLHGIVYYPPGNANLPPWSEGSIISGGGHAVSSVIGGRGPGQGTGGGGSAAAGGSGKRIHVGVKVPGKRGRKKGPVDARNPRPKATRTSFNFFFNERRPQLKQEMPQMAEADISKRIGEEWGKMSGEQKQPYVDTAYEDKKRFVEAWSVYQTNMNAAEASKNMPAGNESQPGEGIREGQAGQGNAEPAAPSTLGGGENLSPGFENAGGVGERGGVAGGREEGSWEGVEGGRKRVRDGGGGGGVGRRDRGNGYWGRRTGGDERW